MLHKSYKQNLTSLEKETKKHLFPSLRISPSWSANWPKLLRIIIKTFMDPRLDSIVRHSTIFAINAMRNGPKQMAYSRGQDYMDQEGIKIKKITSSSIKVKISTSWEYILEILERSCLFILLTTVEIRVRWVGVPFEMIVIRKKIRGGDPQKGDQEGIGYSWYNSMRHMQVKTLDPGLGQKPLAICLPRSHQFRRL